MTSLIDSCPSPAHRAALRMTGVALGGDVPGALIDDLRQSDPVHFASIANVEHVHCLLYTAHGRDDALDAALPEDLWLYFAEMAAANALRTEEARAQLRWIGAQLVALGLEAAVLKGGAGVLDAQMPHQTARFVSDLDLLMTPDRAERAHAAFVSMGAVFEEYAEVVERTSHHLPALVLPGREFPVELHHKVGGGAMARLLPAEAVLDAATASDLPGITLPDSGHRYIHHVLHSHKESSRRQGIYLRAVIDHHAFRNSHLEACTAGDTTLSAADQGAAARQLSLLTDLITGAEPLASATESRMLRDALRAFGDPDKRRSQHLTSLVSGILRRFFTDPEHRRHYIRMLTQPKSIRARLVGHRNALERIR